jgi:spermidine synthase
VLRVYEEGSEPDQYRSLYHGRISHGMQFMDPGFESLPTTYYTEDSGIGIAFTYHSARLEDSIRPLKVGAIGLGVGTVMTYAKPGDDFRFYEINPQVEELARTQFTFLENGEGDETVVLGDARISLQEEFEKSGSREFDILVVDAFSGDSIPLHLLTREAFELYLKHLKPDGILAVHISNLHLDLSAPVRTLATELSLDAIPIQHDPSDDDYVAYYSDWVLLTQEDALRIRVEEAGYDTLWYDPEFEPILWTDDYSNLLDVIDW